METVELKQKYLSKIVLFNGQKMTLYSLDGQTWSSKKIELSEIQERREQQRLALAGKKEEESDNDFSPKMARSDNDYESEEGDDDRPSDDFEMSQEIGELEDQPAQVGKKPKVQKAKIDIKKPKALKSKQLTVAKIKDKPAKQKKALPQKPKIVANKGKKIVAKPAKKAPLSKVKAKPVKKAAAKKVLKKTARKKAA